jgi:hypothetical protein
MELSCPSMWALLTMLLHHTVEGKSPCGQVDLLLRARLLTLKTEDAYHGH